MIYKLIEPDMELYSFESMSKKQAKQYFDWFIETKEERLQKLQSYINSETSEINLDKSLESLITLWKWFQPKIQRERKTDAEIQADLEKRPDWMRVHVLESSMKFTFEIIALFCSMMNMYIKAY